MDCVMPETLYLKANGVFPCHDDAGEVIPLGHLEDGFSLRGLLEGARYGHVRSEFEEGRAPWPGVCERCGFFRPHQAYRARVIYRKNGDFARVQGFIAAAARAVPRSWLIWKYIVFEFNDSTAELQRAQQLAIDHGVDALAFVVTHSAQRSQRFTRHNVEQLLELAPFATVGMTPVLWGTSALPSRQAHSRLRRTRFERLLDSTCVTLKRGLPSLFHHGVEALRARATARQAALHLDETRVIDGGALHVRGWAHDGREPFEHLTLTQDGHEVGSAVLGIYRPDVRRVFPHLRSERVGFAATFPLRDALAATFEIELHARSRGSTRNTMFTMQVTRRRDGDAGAPFPD